MVQETKVKQRKKCLLNISRIKTLSLHYLVLLENLPLVLPDLDRDLIALSGLDRALGIAALLHWDPAGALRIIGLRNRKILIFYHHHVLGN